MNEPILHFDNTHVVTKEDLQRSKIARLEQIVAIITVFMPLIVILSAAFFLWGKGVSATDLYLCLMFYTFTMLGITMGFHRHFTHRSFECGNTLKYILGVAGSMAAQGPVCFWVASHRRHHQSSDDAGDPHSPHNHDGSVLSILKSWWHSHSGWMLTHQPENYIQFIRDLRKEKNVLQINRLYFVWVSVGFILPSLIGGLISQSLYGAVTGLIWGGFVRVFLVHHITWSINSVCHLFGTQQFESKDQSRNNLICAILTFGEGWHNNHHAFPTSARHGLNLWQVDSVYLLLKLLKWSGLVWNIQLPRNDHISKKLLRNKSPAI